MATAAKSEKRQPRKKKASIMPNLNTTILSQMPVLLPSIEEQHRIAEILRACEVKIHALESELPLLDELFEVMLKELTTGRLSALSLVEVQPTQ
jgi:type I restriction enzyme S subunit